MAPMMRKVLIVALMLTASKSWATTLNASSCSRSAFNTQLALAVTGDKILGPGGTDSGGGSRLDIPSTKGIVVDGGGCTINWGFGLTTNATTGTRITNFTFTKAGDNTGANASFKTLGTSLTNAKWRLDHVTFTGGGSNVIELGPEPGLIDHITTNGSCNADEFMHPSGWGAEDETGWTTAMPSAGPTRAQGASEAVFFEDNTFSSSSESCATRSWTEAAYGERLVWRYNQFNYIGVDYHGGGQHSGPPYQNIGGRWWEFYHNDCEKTSAGNQGGFCFSFRAGSGILFSNTKSGSGDSGNIGTCEEGSTGGYPQRYQIGRGTAQALDPAYAWSNSQTVAVNDCEATPASGMVAFNRDIYTAENSASCTAGSTCTAGVGIGTTLPTSCTTNVGFWKTDAGGNWDTTHGGANDGALYKCTSTDTWTLYYTPFTYPYPLNANGLPTTPGGSDTTTGASRGRIHR